MKTVLFQGDSITDCNRVREIPDNKIARFFVNAYLSLKKATPLGFGYPSLVAKELEGKYEFINRGISGDRISDVYSRIVKDVINLKPDYMSLLIGVNDVWRGFDSDFGTGKKRFEKIYVILLEEIREELPDTKIMLMEPFVLRGSATDNREGQPNRYNDFRKEVEEFATATESLAEKYDCKFIRLQKLLDEAAEKSSPSEILSDGVHPTAKGHGIIKNEWIKAFNEL